MEKHKYQLIASAVGLVLSGLGMFLERSGFDGTAQGTVKVLSDGFLVGGAILTLIAVFTIAIRGGLFNGISYAASTLRKKHQTLDSKETMTYFEYTQKHQSDKKSSPLLLPGLGYIVIAIILTILYYHV